MPRYILMHLSVSVPDDDKRKTETIATAVKDALVRGSTSASVRKLGWEWSVDEPEQEPGLFYTVHPFDDEWTWDPKTSGAHPWATHSLEEAIDHANLVRLEYASADDVDPEWIAGFWSAIYADDADPESARADSTDSMIGWVDPQGNYNEGHEPPLDEQGGWKGEVNDVGA